MRGIRTTVLAAVLLSGTVAFAQPPPTEVEAIESVAKMVPVPQVGDGAAYYSPEQLQADAEQATRNGTCIAKFNPGKLNPIKVSLMQKESRIASLAGAASAATEAAEDARRRAARGEADAAELERTELARQAAVRTYEQAIFLQGALGFDPRVEFDPPIAIDVSSATLQEEKGKPVVAIRGVLRNLWPRRAKVPVITVAMYDPRGNLIYASAASPQRTRLKVGEERPFALSVPAHLDAARVAVMPGEKAAYGGRDFCAERRDEALAQAIDYWVGQRSRSFNLPPGGGSR